MSLIAHLDDNCFAEATEALRSVARAFERVAGRKPTLEELSELLTWGARGCAEELICDAPNLAIEVRGRILARLGRQRPRPGDVVAVPVALNQWVIMIYIGAFPRFGHAFGVFREIQSLGAVHGKWQPVVAREFPVFIHLKCVNDGSWPIVAHRPELLGLFRQPTMFFSPGDDPRNDSLGKFGLAESVSGELRGLSQEEAERVFVMDGRSYVQGYLCEEFVRALSEGLLPSPD